MKINELINKLSEIKNKYGDLEIVGNDNYDIYKVEVQKFVKTNCKYNDIVVRQTENLNENYLEEMYIDDKRYSKYFVSKGICVKLY